MQLRVRYIAGSMAVVYRCWNGLLHMAELVSTSQFSLERYLVQSLRRSIEFRRNVECHVGITC
jgi:hypothetical protein